jgi:hypothetical protein
MWAIDWRRVNGKVYSTNYSQKNMIIVFFDIDEIARLDVLLVQAKMTSDYFCHIFFEALKQLLSPDWRVPVTSRCALHVDNPPVHKAARLIREGIGSFAIPIAGFHRM